MITFSFKGASKMTDNKNLLSAVVRGDRKSVKKLLENGADVNMQNELTGNTALMFAVDLGDADMVKLLLDYNPDLNIINKYNETAQDIAVKQNVPQMKLLFDQLVV